MNDVPISLMLATRIIALFGKEETELRSRRSATIGQIRTPVLTLCFLV